MATIQWFPGHMSKARRQVQENLKFIDFVTILVDARLPLSSQNPMLNKIVGDKPKLLILNKADLADPAMTKEWCQYFESQGIQTLAINSKEQVTVKVVTDAAKKLMADKIARQKERGIKIETLRTMIIGIPNAGKSTLMNILGCLDTPTAGSYKLEGLEVADLSDDDLAEIRATRLGFVFQSFNLLPRTTVLRNVMLPLIYSDIPAKERELRAWKALRSVGLPEEYYEHKSNELSGGQVQRVAIARALVNDPAVIFADEPTGNLDSATSEMVLNTFKSMQERGKTIVLITHDPETAFWADRVVHIRDGRLLTDEQEKEFVRQHAAQSTTGADTAPGAHAALAGSTSRPGTGGVAL